MIVKLKVKVGYVVEIERDIEFNSLSDVAYVEALKESLREEADDRLSAGYTTPDILESNYGIMLD